MEEYGGGPPSPLHAVPGGKLLRTHFSDDLSTKWITGFKIGRVSGRDTLFSCWNLGLVAQEYVDSGITIRGENLNKPPNTEDSTRRRSILHIVATTLSGRIYVSPDFRRSGRTWKSVKWIIDPITRIEQSEDMNEYIDQANQQSWGRTVIISNSGHLGLARKRPNPMV